MAGDIDEIIIAARKVGESQNADVILYSGGISTGDADTFIEMVKQNSTRPNVLLICSTPGGDPHSSFRMARYLKRKYKELTLFIESSCKSAGAVFALAADKIIMSVAAELGPLDVQVLNRDEIGEYSSGLIPSQAMKYLQAASMQLFKQHFRDLHATDQTWLGFPTKLAADISAQHTVGLFSPIYAQLDPMRLGEIERAMMIGHRYGVRVQSRNVKEDTLEKLVSYYLSHHFAIDIGEAEKLFHSVSEPSDDLLALALKCQPIIEYGHFKDRRNEPAEICYLFSEPQTPPVTEKTGDGHESQSKQSEPVRGAGERNDEPVAGSGNDATQKPAGGNGQPAIVTEKNIADSGLRVPAR